MIVGFVNFYLQLNVLVAVAALVSLGLRFGCQTGRLEIKASSELKMNYLLLFFCLGLPILAPYSNDSFQFDPIVKIGAANTLANFKANLMPATASTVVASSEIASDIPVDFFFWALALLSALTFSSGVLRILLEMRRLRKILGDSYLIRKIGSVRITVSEQIQIPFSVRIWNAWVLVPAQFLGDSKKMKISILHELQHHRQKDTKIIYLLLFLKAFVFFNPFIWVWERLISEIQEIACDENLVDQGKIRRQEYASCLIEIAETAVKRKGQLACAAGLAFLNDRQAINRRIESMFQTRKSRSLTTKILSVIATLMLTGTALAARGLVADRRVTMDDAQRLAETARSESEFPIAVNDLVLKQLNRYLGTEEGRKFIQASLERMRAYQPMLEGKLKQYHVPSEILAIGIVESGYMNKPQSQNKSWGAGVWMFIESTAKAFGLRVDPGIDERLNVELETDAAMRYLSANYLRFNDWLLAIQAYNSGESAVQTAIEKFATRDVWALVRSGLKTDKDYLAKVMAVVLILKNPKMLN